jgi:hypothetical protein
MRKVNFHCPVCEVENTFPESELFATCHSCLTYLDVKSTLAYLRGLEAFDDGQDILVELSSRKHRSRSSTRECEAMSLFREAYSSIQLAFEGDLVEGQRQLGIEMMASMSQEFAKRSMISAYEGRYWSAVMAELTSQREYKTLKNKLQHSTITPLNFFFCWYWKRRQDQLLDVLKEIARKLTHLEEQIDFIIPPRARNRNWVP